MHGSDSDGLLAQKTLDKLLVGARQIEAELFHHFCQLKIAEQAGDVDYRRQCIESLGLSLEKLRAVLDTPDSG